MKFKIWEWALIAAIIVTFIGGLDINRSSKSLSDKLIRLHVVANSDTEADQALKLSVRDAILDELRTSLKNAENRDKAREIITYELPKLESTAKKVISENAKNYTVKATLCNESFPTTEYDNFSLPAGEYLSLRVTIGEGAGHNWWCVVFPPICDAGILDAETSAAVGLTDSEVGLITGKNDGYVVKFRIMELWGKLIELFR